MFKQHLEMIGRNETPAKKAKFCQSYIRSLKGPNDRAARATSVPPINQSALRAPSVPPPARERNPIFRSGFAPYNSLSNLLNPDPKKPITAFTRDPFWYDLGDLKPFSARIPSNNLPSHLRDSFLSPVKKDFVWEAHPVRPFNDSCSLNVRSFSLQCDYE